MAQVYEKVIIDANGLSFHLSGDPSFTDVRKRHWQNSRLALAQCFIAYQGTTELKALSESDLLIENHHHLKSHPDLLVSISHTRGAAAAALIPQSDSVRGIGIDIEAKDRPIKDGILEKFLNADDVGETPLFLWCAKEAAFKAASAFWPHQKTFVLKDITITDNTFTIGTNLRGTLTHRTEGPYLITTALLEND